MENNEFQNLSQEELFELVDDLISYLRQYSAGSEASESDIPKSDSVDEISLDLNAAAEDMPEGESIVQCPAEAEHGEEMAESEPSFFLPSKKQAEELLERINFRKRYRRTLISTVASLMIIVAAAIIISVVLMPVIRISGGGMEPTYHDGDILVLFNGKDYSSGQLCCVSWQNKLLIRRVIGMPGDVIDIDSDGNVFVNGAQLYEPYAINNSIGECDIEFPYEIPEGSFFIMGDRRDTSIDSRSTVVGCVEKEQIVGRVLFRVWPLGRS